MITARVLSNICYQTHNNYKITSPFLTYLNRKQFYSVNSTNSNNEKKCLFNKHSDLLQPNNTYMSLTKYNNISLPILVRYKSDNIPNQLPSKQQVEKAFFKILGLVLDFAKIVILWTIKTIQDIIAHPKTQELWGRLQDKIQNARKN